MTAGRGVIHQEDPAPGSTVHSLQLWVNLPSSKKLTAPRYQNLKSADMPVRKEKGALIRIFSGSSKGIQAPTKKLRSCHDGRNDSGTWCVRSSRSSGKL